MQGMRGVIEMTKDEMKDKISMALKDPVLQQGFEIICINLAELEKENAELKGIKDIATLIRANNDTVITLMQLNNMLVNKNQRLTKAKELLTKWIELFKPKGGNIPPTPIQVETVQFLGASNGGAK